MDDFLHKNPESTTSVKRADYRKIKFRDEKLWIPWRIRNFGGETINHKGILYPLIFYYKGNRNNSVNSFDITYEFINYKLCNETSMINNSYFYTIDIKLDQLYCIDMEDLDLGGSWDSTFLDLVTLDLYTCKNGIDYNENDTNCTTYEDIIKAAGENDCFEFEMYYPVVQYQPMNKSTPIFVRYINYFYHLSRFSNKIDRIYLQQHILNDDIGFFNKNERKYSYWGSASLNGDSYATGNFRDLMNEGSTSRLYSFNIYLKSDIIFYKRKYKKISLICAEGMPIINVVFAIFRLIAKMLKISSGNKKLTELLFENLKEKKIIIDGKQLQKIKLKSNKNIKSKDIVIMTKNNKDNIFNANKVINNDLSFMKLKTNEYGKKLGTEKIYQQNYVFNNSNEINKNITLIILIIRQMQAIKMMKSNQVFIGEKLLKKKNMLKQLYFLIDIIYAPFS